MYKENSRHIVDRVKKSSLYSKLCPRARVPLNWQSKGLPIKAPGNNATLSFRNEQKGTEDREREGEGEGEGEKDRNRERGRESRREKREKVGLGIRAVEKKK